MADPEEGHQQVSEDASRAEPGGAPGPGGVASLARDLTGDLPCAHCNYNLRGLSIREACPECGVAVRATILAVVDPRAGELKPVIAPKLTAAALVLWPAAAFGAAACVWGLRGTDALWAFAGVDLPSAWLAPASVALLAISAAGACTLIRPIQNMSWWASARASVGCLAYAGVIWAHAQIVMGLDAPRRLGGLGSGGAFMSFTGPEPDRAFWRLVCAAFACVVILGLKGNATRLAYRSVVIRTGRVDRQPMTALVAALGVAASGDLLALFGEALSGAARDIAGWVSLVLVAVGSFLLTLGIWGTVMDGWRVSKVIRTPGIGLADILDDQRGAGR